MRKIFIYFVVIAMVSVMAHAQNEENFQSYLSKIQPVLSKNVEKLTSSDLLLIDEAMSLEADKYGTANRRLCMKIKSDATAKKGEYQDYLTKARAHSKTLDELDDETSLRMTTELQRDSLAEENAKLQALIVDLNSQITKFKKQAEKISKLNKKIQEENLATKDLLQNSSNLVAQMLMLMPDELMQNELMGDVPKDITDSLANAQCMISRLLKTNFTTTLQTLKADSAFMDSAAVYFKENRKHSKEVETYINTSNELIARLRSSGVECAMGNASDIENELNDFLLEIEKRDDAGLSFVDFIKENSIWLFPIILVLAVGVTIVVMNTKKK